MIRSGYWLLLAMLCCLPTVGLRAQGLGDAAEAPVSSVIARLHSADAGQRREAAEQLGGYPLAEACRALIAAAHDADEAVRVAVIGALRWQDDPAAVRAIAAALHDHAQPVRLQAIDGLSHNPNHAAADTLLALLKAANSPHRAFAGQALAERGDVRAIDPLIALVRDYDDELRRVVAEALGLFHDPPTVPRRLAALYGALHDDDADVRSDALGSLFKIHDATTYLKILPSLHDSDSVVREIAVRALLMLRGKRAVPDMLPVTHDPEELVRSVLAEDLRFPGDAATLQVLLVLAKDPAVNVRMTVVRQFHEIGDAGVVPALCNLAKDPSAEVRCVVAVALRQVAGKYATTLDAALRERIVQLSLAGLKDPSAPVVCQMIALAGTLAGRRATGPLIDLLGGVAAQDPNDEQCCQQAYTTLKGLNDPATEDLLTAKLEGADAAHRAILLEALCTLGTPHALAMVTVELPKLPSAEAKKSILPLLASPAAIPLLMRLCHDADPSISGEALARLSECGEQGIQKLFDLAAGDDRELAENVVQMLGLLELTPEMLTAVMQRPEARVRLIIAHQLSAHDRRAPQVLVGLLAEEDRTIRLDAAELLARRQDPRAVEPLTALLDTQHTEATRRATLALANYGDRRAMKPLLALLEAGKGDMQPVIAGLLQSADREATAALLAQLARTLKPEDLPALASLPFLALKVNTGDIPALARMSSDNAMHLYDFLSARPVLKQLLGAINSQGMANPAPFEEALQDRRPEVRVAAMMCLWQLHDPAEGALMAPSLHDVNSTVRLAAARAIEADARYLPLFIALLHDADATVRTAACHWLGQLGDRRAVDPLLEAQRAGNTAAIVALGDIGDARAAKELFSIAVGQGDDEPRLAAIRALGKLARDLPALPAAESRRYCDALLALIRNGKSTVRCAAMEAVGHFHDTRSVPVLLAIIGQCRKAPDDDSNAEMLSSAFFGLQQCGDTRIIDPLVTVLAVIAELPHDTGILKPEILQALLQFPQDPRVRQALRQFAGLEKRDPRPLTELLAAFVEQCNTSLIELSDEELIELQSGAGVGLELARRLRQPENRSAVEKGLLPLLHHPHSETRLGAASLLRETHDPAMVPALQPLLQDNDVRVATMAAVALVSLQAKGVCAELIPLLHVPEAECRFAAVGALGRCGDPAGLTPLLQALADPVWPVRCAAVQSLGLLHDARATEALIAIMQHPGPEVPTGEDDTSDEITRWLNRRHDSIRATAALGEIGDTRAVPALIAALEIGSLDERVAAARAGDAEGSKHRTCALRSVGALWREGAAGAYCGAGCDLRGV